MHDFDLILVYVVNDSLEVDFVLETVNKLMENRILRF